MTYRDIAKAQLRVDEGEKLRLYKDSLGIESIGVGRNLRDVGIHPDELELMFDNDVQDAEKMARAHVPQFDILTENRKAVLLNMAFNLGPKLGNFHDTLYFIQSGDYAKAADEMLDSTWARQVGLRASRLSKLMREG